MSRAPDCLDGALFVLSEGSVQMQAAVNAVDSHEIFLRDSLLQVLNRGLARVPDATCL